MTETEKKDRKTLVKIMDLLRKGETYLGSAPGCFYRWHSPVLLLSEMMQKSENLTRNNTTTSIKENTGCESVRLGTRYDLRDLSATIGKPVCSILPHIVVPYVSSPVLSESQAMRKRTYQKKRKEAAVEMINDAQ